VTTAAHPDLFAFMDAYNVLGVDYAADSSTIRRAHRRLAKQHHPDKFPAGSAEQQQATARMAEINDAYRLVSTAPLKHHRVSKASDPTTPWTDGELDAALHRAQVDQQFDRWMSVALMAVAVIVLPFVSYGLMPMLASKGPMAMPLMLVVGTGVSLVSTFVIWSMVGPGGWRVLYKVWLALLVLRMLGWHF
jgi:hypothetical protein